MDVQTDLFRFLPLNPAAFQILLALADADRHGYAIMQEVAERTHGRVKLGPGTLYGTIKRLLADGLIIESTDRPEPELDDDRRRYYGLTLLGRQVLALDTERLADLVEMARTKQLLQRPSLTAQGGR